MGRTEEACIITALKAGRLKALKSFHSFIHLSIQSFACIQYLLCAKGYPLS